MPKARKGKTAALKKEEDLAGGAVSAATKKPIKEKEPDSNGDAEEEVKELQSNGVEAIEAPAKKKGAKTASKSKNAEQEGQSKEQPAKRGKRGGKPKDDEIEDDGEPAVKKEKKEETKKEPIKKGKKVIQEEPEKESNTDETTEKAPAKRGRKAPKKAEDNDEPAPSKRGRKAKPEEDKSEPAKKEAKKTAKEEDGEPPKLLKNKSETDYSSMDLSSGKKTNDGREANMKIASWNVDGIRAWLKKNGLDYVKQEQPDIICFQETKCSPEKLPEELKEVEGYHCYWLGGETEGYAGVGLLSKEKPQNVAYGIGVKEMDKEGRTITAEYAKFYLVTSYVPNAGKKLVSLPHRMKWDPAFQAYLKDLDSKKPVILCGDLNVSHLEIDLANPKTNKKNAGFTKEERDGFSDLLNQGFVDSFRHLYPDVTQKYTFWTYMMGARKKNVGWRLDYFVMSERFVDNLCDNVIRDQVFGSDHCPILLTIAV